MDALPTTPHCHVCGQPLHIMRVHVFFCHACQAPFVSTEPRPVEKYQALKGMTHPDPKCDGPDRDGVGPVSFWSEYDQPYCTSCQEPRREITEDGD